MRARLLLFAFAACSNAAPVQPDAKPFTPPSPDAAIDAASATLLISYTGGAYSNAFDGLPTTAASSGDVAQTVTGKGPFDFGVLTGATAATGMTGWYFGNPTGSSADTEFRVQDGSQSGSTGRGVISYGADGSTQRALGSLATSNQSPQFGALVRNDTGAPLASMTIGFSGEQWRRGAVTTPDTLTFEYGTGAALDATGLTTDTDLSFKSPNTQATPTGVALDGTAAANRTPLSKTITGLSWPAGATMILRWTANEGAGADDGLAIDDFLFSASP